MTHSTTRRANKKRYAAKLLFQYRTVTCPGKYRLCEERIINFKDINARAALSTAKKEGKKAQYDFKNTAGEKVVFEFIGVMELLCCDPVCGQNEVWYDIKKYLLPSERKAQLIPSEENLTAIKTND